MRTVHLDLCISPSDRKRCYLTEGEKKEKQRKRASGMSRISENEGQQPARRGSPWMLAAGTDGLFGLFAAPAKNCLQPILLCLNAPSPSAQTLLALTCLACSPFMMPRPPVPAEEARMLFLGGGMGGWVCDQQNKSKQRKKCQKVL